VSAAGPLAKYHALRASGALKDDPEQARVAGALDSLHVAMKAYRLPAATGFFRSMFGGGGGTGPKGLYIHGGVGRGKSLLMDLFFESAAVSKKRRVHFNVFMMEVHRHIHEWRNLTPTVRAKRPEFVRDAGDDPIAPVARRIASDAALLCFDEFQVTDVADAMILGRLFEKLLGHGVVLVVTSNTPPEKLYEGGLNRQLFLPFIEMLRTRLTVLELDGGQDYRRLRLAGLTTYNTPLGLEADAAMDAAWTALSDGALPVAREIDVHGRTLAAPRTAGRVARFDFEELCGQPLGAGDYIALSGHFDIFLIDHIPVLSPEQANEARRFALLIDTLYDEHLRLVCSAAARPDALFDAKGRTNWFLRTASRLTEMQSEAYLAERPRRLRHTPALPGT
jgi:cell division protein ZapE